MDRPNPRERSKGNQLSPTWNQDRPDRIFLDRETKISVDHLHHHPNQTRQQPRSTPPRSGCVDERQGCVDGAKKGGILARQGLTPKQEAFALHYATSGDASASYKLAYNAAGMLPQTIAPAAQRVLNRDNVGARIAELRERAAAANDVTAERVIREMAMLAFGTLDEVAPWDANGAHLIPSAQLPREKRALVQSVKIKRTRRRENGRAAAEWEVEYVEVKAYDKRQALRDLADILGFGKEKDIGDTNIMQLIQVMVQLNVPATLLRQLATMIPDGGGNTQPG